MCASHLFTCTFRAGISEFHTTSNFCELPVIHPVPSMVTLKCSHMGTGLVHVYLVSSYP